MKSSELFPLLLFCVQQRLLLPLFFRFEGDLIGFLFHSSHLQQTNKQTTDKFTLVESSVFSSLHKHTSLVARQLLSTREREAFGRST